MITINSDCPFCNSNKEKGIISENKTFFLRLDLYPISKGHILLIPKRHISSIFDLNYHELIDFYDLMRLAREYLDDKYSPNGFNIGINEGEAGGQTINHLHVHLIPRYLGDVIDPTGGVRNLIPEKASYPQ